MKNNFSIENKYLFLINVGYELFDGNKYLLLAINQVSYCF